MELGHARRVHPLRLAEAADRDAQAGLYRVEETALSDPRRSHERADAPAQLFAKLFDAVAAQRARVDHGVSERLVRAERARGLRTIDLVDLVRDDDRLDAI